MRANRTKFYFALRYPTRCGWQAEIPAAAFEYVV